MRFVPSILSLLLGAGIASGLPAPAEAADVTLRFASINLANTEAYRQILEPFARKVEADSNQRIAVELKPLGGYGKPTELFSMVERGDIEIAATVQGYSRGRFPQSSVMELPLMFDTAERGTRAFLKLHQEGLLDRDYASVKVLGLYMLPPYGIFTSGRKVETLKDLRGMRVRTPSPTVGLALIRLGMIPIGIPTDMIGEMLHNNTVDAITYGWDALTTGRGFGDQKLVDQVRVMVDANFAAPALMVVMNKAAWDALPADLKTVIDKHAMDLSLANARLRDVAEAASRGRLKSDANRTYVALPDAMRAEMERLIAPALADWKAMATKQGVDAERLYIRAQEVLAQAQTASR